MYYFYSVLCNIIRHDCCCCCFWLIIQIMYSPANRVWQTNETVKRSWSDSDQLMMSMSSLRSHVRFSVCVCAKGKARLISCIISACEQSIAGSRSVKEISCTTACHSTAALLQTGTSTSILTLHRHFLSARYLSGLSFSGEYEQYDRKKYWTERHVTRCGDDGWGSFLFKKLAGRGGHDRVIRCASGMAICLPHKAASRAACRHACILIGLICSTIGRCRLIKKCQKSADKSVDL